ncbi:hypothetical protein D3C87_1691100 [compost metagenome]
MNIGKHKLHGPHNRPGRCQAKAQNDDQHIDHNQLKITSGGGCRAERQLRFTLVHPDVVHIIGEKVFCPPERINSESDQRQHIAF